MFLAVLQNTTINNSTEASAGQYFSGTNRLFLSAALSS
jgi:hypothetical protein